MRLCNLCTEHQETILGYTCTNNLTECADFKLKNNSTCFTCQDNQICQYAYDEYNINGDCLAMK